MSREDSQREFRDPPFTMFAQLILDFEKTPPIRPSHWTNNL
jgi:hypothetical protein